MAEVLLLHGFPFSSRMWEPQVPALEAAGHRVVVPDLPGFGATPPLAEPSLDGFATHALDELDRAGIDSAAVCGLSMGGYVALRFLALAPERVSVLVLADTRSMADTEVARQRRIDSIDRIGREGKAWLPDEMLPMLLGPHATEDLHRQVRAMMDEASPEGTAGALQAMAERSDATDLLRASVGPVRLIAGAFDTMTPADEMREMAAGHPDVEFYLLEGVGHLSNLEDPEGFNEALLASLSA